MALPALLHDIADLIYPPACAHCSSPDLADNSEFCQTCTTSLTKLLSTNSCPHCARPLGPGSACPYCRGNGLHSFKQIVALAPYRDPLRKLVHQMKYHHRWTIAEILADHLLAQARVKALLAETDILIPIPLHWTRQIARGYNQSHTLAARLAKKSTCRLSSSLTRLKNTPAQMTLRSQLDRTNNLRNAFAAANIQSIRNKRITLIDDVLTTGATLKSAARAISSANPAAINAIVLAVSDPRRRDFQSALAAKP